MKKMKSKIVAVAMLLGIFGLLNMTTSKVEAQESLSYSLANDGQSFDENNPITTTILRQAFGYWEAGIGYLRGGDRDVENYPSNVLD